MDGPQHGVVHKALTAIRLPDELAEGLPPQAFQGTCVGRVGRLGIRLVIGLAVELVIRLVLGLVFGLVIDLDQFVTRRDVAIPIPTPIRKLLQQTFTPGEPLLEILVWPSALARGCRNTGVAR